MLQQHTSCLCMAMLAGQHERGGGQAMCLVEQLVELVGY